MTDAMTFLAAGKWTPERSGDYGRDCATGRAAADELMAHMRATGNPVIFGSVVRAIVAAGVYDGVEIGFCSAIGISLIGLIPTTGTTCCHLPAG